MSHLGGPRLPYGAVMIESLKACGGPGFLVLLVASAALVVAVVAAAVAFSGRRKPGSVLAGTALFLAGATGLTGFTGTLLGHAQAQRAAETAGLTKADKGRILHQAGLEARTCSRMGVGAMVLPFLVACIAGGASLFGKGKGEEEKKGDEAEGAATEGARTTDGPIVPLVLLGAATAFTGLLAAGGLGAARVAGADYEPLVWSLMAKSERVVAVSGEEVAGACEALEGALAGDADPATRGCGARIELDLAAVSDLPRASEICIRDRVALMGKSAPSDRKPLAKATRCSATFGVLPSSAKATLEPQVAAFE